MAILCQDLKPLRMYSSARKLHLPFNEEDKKKGSAVFLLTPNAASSNKTMNLPYLINKKTYESYYIERDCTYLINHENHLIKQYDDEFIPIMEAIDESINDISTVTIGSICERVEGDRTYTNFETNAQSIELSERDDAEIKAFNPRITDPLIASIDDMHTFVTSDLHLGKDGGHGKLYIDEIIKKINFRVRSGDTLIICGDLLDSGSKEEDKRILKYFLSNIRTKNTILVLGNNDILSIKDYQDCGIGYVTDYLSKYMGNNTTYVFTHYPKEVSGKDINFCGHLHSSTMYWNVHPENCINVGYPNVKNNKSILCIHEFLMKRKNGDYSDSQYVYKDLGTLKEALMENMIFSKEDIELNLDKWGENENNNILFITGFSGSGKSTLAKRYNNVEVISLDQLYQGVIHQYTEFGRIMYDECIAYKRYAKAIANTEPATASDIYQTLLYILRKAKDDFGKKRYVLEGVQIYRDVPRELVYGKPLIVKGTSALTSALNRIRREDGFTTHSLYKGIFGYFKWYSIDNKLLKQFEKDAKANSGKMYNFGDLYDIMNENLIFNKKDVMINVNKWGTSPQNNVLFVTGLHGALFGPLADKAAEIANINKSKVTFIPIHDIETATVDKEKDAVGKAFAENKIYQYWKACIKKGCEMSKNDAKGYISYFVKLILKVAEERYGKEYFVIGGPNLNQMVDFKYIKNRPLIINGASVSTALARYAETTSGSKEEMMETIKNNLDWWKADDRELTFYTMIARLSALLGGKPKSVDELMKEAATEDTNFVITESSLITNDTGYIVPVLLGEDARITTLGLQSKDSMVIFNEMLDEDVFYEATKSNNGVLKKLLYQERIRNNQETANIYKMVKEANPWIKYTRFSYKLYGGKNLFIDTYYYTEVFMRNNYYKLDKACNLYYDFISRYVDDKRLDSAGYKDKYIFIPVCDWKPFTGHIWNYKESINPISVMYYMMKTKKLTQLKKGFANYKVIFLGNTGYFTMDFDNFDEKNIMKFKTFVDRLAASQIIEEEPDEFDPSVDSARAITTDIISRIEKTQHIKIDYITGKKNQADSITKTQLNKKIEKSEEDFKANGSPKTKLEMEREEKKKELVERIETVAARSNNADEAIEDLDQDERIKQLLMDLANEEDNSVKVSAARASRMAELNNKFHKQTIDGMSVKKMLDEYSTSGSEELTETALPVNSINDEWHHMKFMNFNKEYNVNEDIVAILDAFSSKSVPVSVRDIDIQNTTTSEDLKETWTVAMEDIDGQRFTLKFDIPKFKDTYLLRLRGNDKSLGGQLMNLPVIKTDANVCQLTSNYNKIFVRLYGSAAGKSYVYSDRLIKALKKYSGKFIKVSTGDNSKICSKYELPLDYIDLASVYNTITINSDHYSYTIYFNQDEIRQKAKIDDKNGIPFAVNNKGEVMYYNGNNPISYRIISLLEDDPKFREVYEATKPGVKYTYSKASILNTEIPVIVIMGYSEGLIGALKKSKIDFAFTERDPSSIEREIRKPDFDPKSLPEDLYRVIASHYDFIRFSDGYLLYTLDQASSLLMNGLKECDTGDYSIKEVNTKAMWVNFLDNFGGRLRADGLDNFYDLFVDPITKRVCNEYDIPDDYIEMLAYANFLLADNKYNKHTDLSGNRYRYAEIVAGHAYKCLAKSYADYRTMKKRSNKATMSIKQSAIIDSILLENTLTDSSTISEINYMETAHSVSFKGLSGMNSDRSYGLDKRTYDDSMINLVAMSTGFASTVGVNRQTTVDMNIKGTRGFIKTTTNPDDMNDVNTLSITEALTPFGTISDDPFRTAMTLVQTSKHSMRVAHSSPNLVTNGADDAIAYITPDIFAYKSKGKGRVSEITSDYMILEYNDGSKEFVDLREKVYKNSDGGFFVTVKLDIDLKEGSLIKENQVVAYDKLSYTTNIGFDSNPTLNNGMLTKIAICTTDEGYEDSGIMSQWMSEAMSSDVVVEVPITLPKSTNVYNIVKKGQAIQEGDPLIIFQHAFDDADVNALLKNLTDDEDVISDLGRIPVRSKITGIVQDIIIYRTVEIDELSDSLNKLVTDYEKNITRTKKIIEKVNPDQALEYDSNYKLEATGKLKDAADSVKIVFYLKYKDDMSIGDKTVMNSALKSVMKDIFPEGKEPRSEFRPDEPIEALLAMSSVNNRMVTSVFRNGLINKAMIELDRKIKEMNGIKWKNLRDI